MNKEIRLNVNSQTGGFEIILTFLLGSVPVTASTICLILIEK